ncbi:hypothetical protein [Peribacillus sp. TH24]|uniref:hypothetical protein n=1 Tax=Peribacillus sp. TH24 TaxID=2798483 RepID=UPI001A921713|nr:hypothetical protein [Peribacillus sp. TH24]
MKVQIIGGSGSGKSTLAKFISENKILSGLIPIIIFGKMIPLQKITRLKNVGNCIRKTWNLTVVTWLLVPFFPGVLKGLTTLTF